MTKLSTPAEKGAKMFPELNQADIQACDVLVKSTIMGYTNPEIDEVITELLVRELAPKLKADTHDIIRKKCKKLAHIYLENDNQFVLQENWFCMLAYFISIDAMICRIANLNSCVNDWISFLSFFVALIVWQGIVKIKPLMSGNAYHFLNCLVKSFLWCKFTFRYLACLCG